MIDIINLLLGNNGLTSKFRIFKFVEFCDICEPRLLIIDSILYFWTILDMRVVIKPGLVAVFAEVLIWMYGLIEVWWMLSVSSWMEQAS